MKRLTITRDTLLLQSIEELEVGNLNNNPPDKACNSRDIHEPSENNRGIVADGEVDKRRWEQTESDCPERSPPSIAIQKYLGGMSIGAQPIERPRGEKDAGRSTADCRRGDDRVDDRWQSFDSCFLESDHEWRLLSCSCRGLKLI